MRINEPVMLWRSIFVMCDNPIDIPKSTCLLFVVYDSNRVEKRHFQRV